MCGIAGFYLARNERPDTARLIRAMHIGIDPRGGDATGAAWVDRAGATHHFTVVGRARQFRSAHPNAGAAARMAILHTRMATQGKPENPLNNHPIRSGHFLAVHNGHIYNDDELFASIGIPRNGEVDSEAAVALIRHAHIKGEDVWTALERLEGRAALAWYDDRNPDTLHLARGSSSPLFVVMTTKGSILFASTVSTLAFALDEAGMVAEWEYEVKEGEYLRFNKGRLMQQQTFKPNPGYFSSRWTSYAPDQGKSSDKYAWANEPFVLGPKAKNRKAGERSFTVVRDTGTDLVPYTDDVYDEAWEHSTYVGRSILSVPLSEPLDEDDLHEALLRAEAEDALAVPEQDWHWDDKDMYHVLVKSLGNVEPVDGEGLPY